MALCLTACVGSAAIAQDYTLVWSDEFDGTELDLSTWEPQTGTGTAFGLPAGWGNNEKQYYTNFPANLSVSDGTLKITALQQSFAGSDYTSARIRSRGNQEFLYGRMEGRLKLPSTPGAWPAFWMLPTNSPYGGWASSGEIDIMESVNFADRIYGTIHYGAPFPGNQQKGEDFADGTDFSDDFHVYAIEWDPDEIRWYLDDINYSTLSKDEWFSSLAISNDRAPFDVPFHFLLNVAVGGNFPGDPNGSSVFPQTLEVDYVRVYQQLQSAFGGDPSPIPGRIEAEDFDLGIQDQSYNDCDTANQGGSYRDTGVDIEPSSEGNFNVSYMCEGEWIEYTVDVASAGTYDLDVRVASRFTGGVFSIESDGQDLTGLLSFPATGDWQNWTTVSSQVELEAGVQTLRFVNEGIAGFEYNFNWLEFTAVDNGCSSVDLATPFGQLNFLDVSAFLSQFSAGNPDADLTADGQFNFLDISEFLQIYGQGCP
ncbi:MAG: family 16 glycosylhydrolase [Phycisphaerales bacterium]